MSEDRSRRLAVVIPLVLAAAAFAFHLNLSFKLDSLEGFAVLNTFFGADPNHVVEAFSGGEDGGTSRTQISVTSSACPSG
ncbi:MAG: hypothetical protein ABIE42_09475 [Candidatus Eisenbacteria bacterium]